MATIVYLGHYPGALLSVLVPGLHVDLLQLNRVLEDLAVSAGESTRTREHKEYITLEHVKPAIESTVHTSLDNLQAESANLDALHLVVLLQLGEAVRVATILRILTAKSYFTESSETPYFLIVRVLIRIIFYTFFSVK